VILEPGTRLGPYEITRLIGQGGMGVVYQARDVRLKRDVAIKVLPSESAADAGRIRRFEQEAQAASALNHANIAAIYGIDSVEGTTFIAMEYVPGRTLAEMIPRKGLNPNQALRYAVQIADALARAHAGGVIHRDLKPGNIMVTPEDGVKLLDFGIAKLIHRDDGSAPDVTRTIGDLTAEGVVVGTTRYMAPEQARGQRVDPRADIFSFGAVLYEMVTGHYAFQGASVAEISTAVLRDNPKPLSDLASDLPADFERVITKCLRKDPARRFQTAADLKVALEDLCEETKSAERAAPVPPTRHRRAALVLVPALAGVAALGLWWVVARPGARPASVEQRVVPLTTEPGDELMPSLSPDGTQVAYVAVEEGRHNTELYVQSIEAGTRLQLTHSAESHGFPRWSPDGKWIAYRTHAGGLFLISPLGGPARKILEPPRFSDYCWMPDGQRVLFASVESPAKLQTLHIHTGNITPVAELLQLGRWSLNASLAVSHDGELIATGEADPISRQARIVIRRWQNNQAVEQRTIPLGFQGSFSGVHFLPAGQGLVFTAGPGPDSSYLFRAPLDGSPPTRIANVDHVAFSPTINAKGDRLAFMRPMGDENLYKLALAAPGEAAGASAAFAHSTARDGTPNISFDGTKVAFGSRRTGRAEIYVADPTGQNAARLTSTGAMIGGSARFSPDTKRIAFDSRPPGGQSDIFVIPVDGGPPQNVSNHAATDTVPSWSRDGRFIYFHSDRSGSSQVWKMRADGSSPQQVTRDGGYIAYEAVDGGRIFYSKTDEGGGLWTAGANGGNERMLVPTLYRHNLAPTRSGVYLSTARGLGGGPEILFYRFDDQTTKTVYRLPRQVALGLSVAPDESWLLFSQLDGSGADLMLIDGFSVGR
jgi:Tol biopolymer transport system component/predicted Ser/Thr protein kinase